jgi:ubiquinone/menaquinone biosynthesis C-methylase UbiE
VTQYDNVRWRSAAGIYTDTVQKEIVGYLLGDLRDQKMIEVGVGTGRLTAQLIENGAQVTGVDISLSMLHRTSDDLSSCSLVQADGVSLPFHIEHFDGCLSINVFSHVVNYEAVLQEIARVLRPGGFVVMNFPNLWSYYLPAGVLVNARGRAVRRDVYTRWYTWRSFRLACARAGLSVEQVVGQVHLPDSVSAVGLSAALRKLDQLSRDSFLRYFCPTLFVRAVRIDRG